MSTYREPLEKFLKLGKPDTHQPEDWPNYIEEYELSAEYIPDLIQMMLDNSAEEFIDPDSFAAVYAWRCLGQLKTEQAINALIEVIKRDVWEDWSGEEIPDVLAMIGEPALEPLKEALAEAAHDYELRPTTFESALEQIAEKNANLKDSVAEILVEQLKKAENNDKGLNGFIISTLCDLKHTAALPIIETAYKGHYVDIGIMGRWYDAQVEMGVEDPEVYESDEEYNSFDRAFPPEFREKIQRLFGGLETSEKPAPEPTPEPHFLPSWDEPDSFTPSKSQAKKKKKKRKMAQKSRKQNRKKKKKKK